MEERLADWLQTGNKVRVTEDEEMQLSGEDFETAENLMQQLLQRSCIVFGPHFNFAIKYRQAYRKLHIIPRNSRCSTASSTC